MSDWYTLRWSDQGVHLLDQRRLPTEETYLTLRTVECIGGCGWATVVAVNNRHRLRVSAADVPALVKEIRG